MAKLRARGALRREAAGEGADFVAAADVNDRALEDRVYREASTTASISPLSSAQQ
jgi:hypothetical protein